MSKHHAGLLCVSLAFAAIVAPFAPLHASPVFSHYRGVTLGDSLPTVLKAFAADAASVKVLHERPSLVQELTWRPQRYVSGTTVTADPLSEIVLSFHLGHLVRIAANYDRQRTHGLTDDDLRELLGAVYGTALLPSHRATATQAFERRIIGRWGDLDTTVALWVDEYPRGSGLTISAPAAAARMDEAVRIGAGLSAAAEPERRRAADAAAAAAIVDREALIRAQNKAGFKP